MERIHDISKLAHWYVRQPNSERQSEGWRRYKKGWEVRLVFEDFQRLELARGLLTEIVVLNLDVPSANTHGGYSHFMG